MEPQQDPNDKPITAPAPAEPVAGSPLPARRGRALLQKLRDLNLSAARIAVHPRLVVSLAGCASLDLSATSELRYRVRTPLCDEEQLLIALDGDGLLVARLSAEGELRARRRVALQGGTRGPATAPELRARMDPDTAGSRETERFLRRLVRAVFPHGPAERDGRG